MTNAEETTQTATFRACCISGWLEKNVKKTGLKSGLFICLPCLKGVIHTDKAIAPGRGAAVSAIIRGVRGNLIKNIIHAQRKGGIFI